MSAKEKALEKLEEKVENIERFIAKNGVGSKYLSKAEQVQRDINLALVIGGAVGLIGVSAWALLNNGE